MISRNDGEDQIGERLAADFYFAAIVDQFRGEEAGVFGQPALEARFNLCLRFPTASFQSLSQYVRPCGDLHHHDFCIGAGKAAERGAGTIRDKAAPCMNVRQRFSRYAVVEPVGLPRHSKPPVCFTMPEFIRRDGMMIFSSRIGRARNPATNEVDALFTGQLTSSIGKKRILAGTACADDDNNCAGPWGCCGIPVHIRQPVFPAARRHG